MTRGLDVVVLAGAGQGRLRAALEPVVAALTARGHRALAAPPYDARALLAGPHDARVVALAGADDPALDGLGSGAPALVVAPPDAVAAGLRAGAAAALPLGDEDDAGALARALDALLGPLERRATDERWTASTAALLAALPLAALVVVDEVVVHANPGAGDLFGIPEAELAGWSLAALFSVEDAPEVRRRALAAAAWSGDARLAEGGDPVRVTLVPAVWRGRDALHVLLRETSSEGEAARALAEARAVVAERQELVFLGGLVQSLVHDLRNPLQAALFALAGARGGPRGQPPGEALGMLERKVREIDAILAEVHEYAQPWRPTRLPFPAVELLHGARSAVLAGAAERGVELVVDDVAAGFEVSVDPPRLKHALANLTWLAVEASPPGSRVTLRAGRDDDGRRAWLEVDDDRVAPPGAEAQAAATAGRGARRRLAISHRIVEAHGGALRLERRAPQGLRARLLLG